MKKILVKVKNCTLYYNGKAYKVDEVLEIEEKFFREDYLEKVSSDSNKKSDEILLKEEENNNSENKSDVSITIKELKIIAKKNEISLDAKDKVGVINELSQKLEEKELNLDDEISIYLKEKEENEENS